MSYKLRKNVNVIETCLYLYHFVCNLDIHKYEYASYTINFLVITNSSPPIFGEQQVTRCNLITVFYLK